MCINITDVKKKKSRQGPQRRNSVLILFLFTFSAIKGKHIINFSSLAIVSFIHYQYKKKKKKRVDKAHRGETVF